MIISQIVAAARNYVIGSGKRMLWHLPKDMKYFMETTKGHHVLMGRITYESLPEKFRPLPDRTNIVITRNPDFRPEGAHVFSDYRRGIEMAAEAGEEELFIIGGGQIYEQTLPLTDRIYLTAVQADVEGEVRYPQLDENEWLIVEISEVEADDKHAWPFHFLVLERKLHLS